MASRSVARSNSAPLLDWPLSCSEKRGCVLRLYDQDVRAANAVIKSSEETMAALQAELANSKSPLETSTSSEEPAREAGSINLPADHDDGNQAKDAAAQLRAAIASATAALQALECTTVKDKTKSTDEEADHSRACDFSPPPQRARSEGPVSGILCKDKDARRHSRGPSSGQKRRVSFGKLPTRDDVEPEPEEFAPEKDVQPVRHVDLATPWKPSVTPLLVGKGSALEPDPFADVEADPEDEWQSCDGGAEPTVRKADSDEAAARPRSTKKLPAQAAARRDDSVHREAASTQRGRAGGDSQAVPDPVDGAVVRQKSSDKLQSRKAVEQTTPRRGRQVVAEPVLPKKTGRVWRPGKV